MFRVQRFTFDVERNFDSKHETQITNHKTRNEIILKIYVHKIK